ncbi:uncharacterized protein [Nicotiana sylvestris]|uniref:uncharacterized protein n=1 Tax=Nicotiana sylvestris TaxID=4096 RepID=UPI00388CA34C
MTSNGLAELKSNGRRYTWTNGSTYSKIDRAIINTDWLLSMPQNEVWVMDPHCSDHSPLSIGLDVNEEKNAKPFKFLNHVAEHDNFLKIVDEAWRQSYGRQKMWNVWKKMKKVKQAMKELNKAEYNDVGVKVKEYKQKLIEVQEHMRDPGQNRQLIEDEKVA